MAIDKIQQSISVSAQKPTTPVKAKPEAEKSAEVETRDLVEISGKPGEQKEAEAPARKKWTVLAYLNGKDGNLQRLAPSALRELEAAGSDDNLNIVAQLSRQKSLLDRVSKDWSGTRRYYVERNPDPPGMQDEMMNWFIPPYTKNIISPVKEDLGDKVDMGDPKTLENFIKWGMENYPAEHYAILVYGQGGGFAGSVADADTKNVIDNKELAQVMGEAAKTAGGKIDVLAFDGNLMSQLEVADQIKDSTKILVGSEGTVGLGSLPLDSIVKNLKFELQDRDVTPEELAKFFVFEVKYQPGPAAELLAPTLSAVNLEKVGQVKEAFNGLAKEIQSAIAAKPELKEALAEDIKATQNFVKDARSEPYSDYRDVGHFAKIIKEDDRFNNWNFGNMKTACDALTEAVKAAVIDEAHIGSAVKNAEGISAYMPTDYGFDLPPTFFDKPGFDPGHGFKDTSVGQDTVWGDVLTAIAKDTKFHNFLKKVGFSSSALNKVDKIGAGGLKAAKFALGFASKAGYYEAYQAMRKKPPGSYFKIPGEIAAKIGIAGGAYSSFQGAAQVFEAITNDEIKNRKTMAIDGALDAASGAAVAAACIGMSFATASGVAFPAGIASVAIPVAKMVYDMYNQFSQTQKAKDAMSDIKPSDKLRILEMDKDSRTKENEKDTYISPVVRFLGEHRSSGPVDPKMI